LALRKFDLAIAVVVLAAALFLAYSAYSTYSRQTGIAGEEAYLRALPSENITIGGTEYKVLIANTLATEETGLMNATPAELHSIGAAGMMFVFGAYGDLCFWMENTEMPLEQAWITNDTVWESYNASAYSTNTVCNYGSEVLEVPSASNIYISAGSVVAVGARP
jgi:uncharacterized membrane protein (UPF0127 family)